MEQCFHIVLKDETFVFPWLQAFVFSGTKWFVGKSCWFTWFTISQKTEGDDHLRICLEQAQVA